MSTARKILLAILLVSLTGTAFGAGTFATFTASTTNAGSTFASGTLILKNARTAGGGGTATNSASAASCWSAGTGDTGSAPTGAFANGNANTTCGALFTVTTAKPGETATINLELKNEGSINAGNLQMAWSGAVCDDTNATGATSYGNGELCSSLQVTVEEYTDNTMLSVGWCRYGYTTGPTQVTSGSNTTGACLTATQRTLAQFNTDTSGNWDLGTHSDSTVAVLKPTKSRYFKIRLTLPSTADNTMQGRQVGFAVLWQAVQ